MSYALLGYEEAKIEYKGEVMPAPEVLRQAGLPVEIEMTAKEASALINGSTTSLAVAVLAVADAENIVRHADIGLALLLESMRCEPDAFDAGLHRARPHIGQALVKMDVASI